MYTNFYLQEAIKVTLIFLQKWYRNLKQKMRCSRSFLSVHKKKIATDIQSTNQENLYSITETT